MASGAGLYQRVTRPLFLSVNYAIGVGAQQPGIFAFRPEAQMSVAELLTPRTSERNG